MPAFEIETYKVSSYLERFTGETRPTRVLELTGPVGPLSWRSKPRGVCLYVGFRRHLVVPRRGVPDRRRFFGTLGGGMVSAGGASRPDPEKDRAAADVERPAEKE